MQLAARSCGCARKGVHLRRTVGWWRPPHHSKMLPRLPRRCPPLPPPLQPYGSADPGATATGASKAGAGGFKLASWRGAFWATVLGTTLAVVGVAAWGLASSIKLTDTTVSDVWDLVEDAQEMVGGWLRGLRGAERGGAKRPCAFHGWLWQAVPGCPRGADAVRVRSGAGGSSGE